MKPLRKLSKGTLGGLCALENFHNREKRDNELLINYDDDSRTFLTWTCMKDKETDFSAKNDEVPENARNENGDKIKNAILSETSPLKRLGTLICSTSSNQ